MVKQSIVEEKKQLFVRIMTRRAFQYGIGGLIILFNLFLYEFGFDFEGVTKLLNILKSWYFVSFEVLTGLAVSIFSVTPLLARLALKMGKWSFVLGPISTFTSLLLMYLFGFLCMQLNVIGKYDVLNPNVIDEFWTFLFWIFLLGFLPCLIVGIIFGIEMGTKSQLIKSMEKERSGP